MTSKRIRRNRAAAPTGNGQPAAVARRALPMRTFSQSLPMALLRAREAVMRRFRPGLRNHGVTEQQWRVLRALAHSGPLAIRELASATFLLAPSLSRILPDLESRSLIRRRQADADLRSSLISLEPRGLRLIATHAPYSEEIYDGIERHFGAERLAQLFLLLRELETSLEDARSAPSSKARVPARRMRRSATDGSP